MKHRLNQQFIIFGFQREIMRFACLFLVLIIVGCSSETKKIDELKKQLECKEKEIVIKEPDVTLDSTFEQTPGDPAKEMESEDVSASKKSSTFKIGNLEVMSNDLGQMSWKDAKKACADLGDGWRLPTRVELNLLYQNKESIGGFDNYEYWSSESADQNSAWIQYFGNGYQYTNDGAEIPYVRAVRTFKNRAQQYHENQ
jgi:hypothetical protein